MTQWSYTRSPERQAIYRRVINRLVLGQVSAKEVADSFGVPASTVRWWKHKCLKQSPSIPELRSIAAEMGLMWQRYNSKGIQKGDTEILNDSMECLRKVNQISRQDVCSASLHKQAEAKIPTHIRPLD